MLASLIKKNKFNIDYSPSFKLNSIRFLPCLEEVTAFVNNFYEAQFNNVSFRFENTLLIDHFLFGDTMGPAKVSRAHCSSRLGLPLTFVGGWSEGGGGGLHYPEERKIAHEY